MKAPDSDTTRAAGTTVSQGVSPVMAGFVRCISEEFDTDATSQLLHSGRNTVRRFTLADGSVAVVKRFKVPNFFQGLGWLVRGSKARRAFGNAAELRARGFNTPQAFGFTECGRAPFGCGHAYLITDEIVASPIQTALEKPQRFDAEVATAFARYAAALHEAGILHHDLNSTNVLYTRNSEGHFSFSLIDINRMTFMPIGETPPMKACLTNLLRFTGRYDVMEAVARAYAECRGLDPDSFARRALAAKRCHDRLWRLRKSFKRLLSRK